MPIHYRHPRVQDDQEKPGHFLSLNWSSLDGTHLILPVQTPPPPLHPIYLAQPCLPCPGTYLLLVPQGLPGQGALLLARATLGLEGSFGTSQCLLCHCGGRRAFHRLTSVGACEWGQRWCLLELRPRFVIQGPRPFGAIPT